MTRIDFYILSDKHSQLKFLPKLTEKIYRQGHKLHIQTADVQVTDRLDSLLWTYRDISFIPHERVGTATEETAITIGHEESPPDCHEVLINIANDVPLFFSRFERVVEIIEAGDSHRQQGRVRYQYYRDRGYELSSHNIE